jgi:hypothetical protein
MSRLDRATTSRLRTLGTAIFLLTFAASLAGSPRAHAATIRSTAAGGPWSLGSTWVGGIVPAASDDVALDGTVTMQGTATCASLEVTAAGRLRNASGVPSTLVVNGSVANIGTIEDAVGTLRLRVGGDLDNDGVWTNVETILIGAADHRLSQSATATFESNLTRDAAASGALFIDTPFAILGNIDQDGGQVFLAADCPLTLRAGALSGDIFAQGNEIRFESWSYIDGGTFDAAVLSGAATATSGTFTNGLTILNSLSNVGSFGNAHISVRGSLINFGMIYNDTYGFTMDLAGDLECYGTMLNSTVEIDDAEPRALRMGPNGNVDTDLILPEFGTGTFVVETDARISEGVSLGEGGTMILEPGVTLTLSGGSLTGGTLLAQGNDIFMEGSGYIWINEVDDVALRGTVQTAGPMSVAQNVRVFGTLQNWTFSASEIIVEGDVINTGLIRDNSQTLTLRIRGDARNGGAWENQRVVLDGAEDQLVEIGAGIGVPEFVLAAGFISSSYQWTRDGTPLAGETAQELQFASVATSDAGIYRCEGGEGQLSRAIEFSAEIVTGLPLPEPNAIAVLTLAPPSPNPVRATQSSSAATIDFALPAPGRASLDIFDAAGRLVTRLASRSFPAGSHRVTWPVTGAASGVYFVRLESSGAVATRKLTIVE